MSQAGSARRRCLVAVLAVGVGLAAAPLAFGMFSRAPAGGRMITAFKPFMSTGTIDGFRGYLAEIDAAAKELQAQAPRPASGALIGIREWQRQWPDIDRNMREMLATMEDEIGHYRGVAALPPFPLFPWFFVIPGVLAAGLAVAGLWADRRGRWRPGVGVALIALGIGLIAAPAVFQMFTRAPGGARMIDEFRPLMTTAKVTDVQQYFLVLGAAEGELRTQVLADTAAAPSLPAVRRFVRDWPTIANEMAPMIGAMSDNVDNFAAVDALPPFWLFPWFFVAPGLLVGGLAVGSRRGAAARSTDRVADAAVLEGTTA